MSGSTTARVRLTVDVSCDSSWSDDCAMGQVRKQAEESARRILATASEANKRIRIVSIDEIQSVTVRRLTK